MKNLTVRKILDLYTINEALSNAQLKPSLKSLLFFSIFFVQRYNTSAIHPHLLGLLVLLVLNDILRLVNQQVYVNENLLQENIHMCQ
jgi:hypothetical protein